MEFYGEEWFRTRALDSLKRIDDRTWDYSDSLLLYLPEGEEEYETIQEEGNPYSEIITKPEMRYLEEIAEEIVAELPDKFEYIDLGPGTAHKEQFIFTAVKKADKQFIYVPVDISSHYLELSEQYASAQGISVAPLRTSFEELPTRLKKTDVPRFVSLGLTFSNYAPSDILPLLKSIAGKDGMAFINTHIRERTDMQKVKDIYKRQVSKVFDPKLRLLDLCLEDISERVVDDGITVWYTLQHSNPLLEKIGIRAGDRLLVFRSLRYTKDDLEKVVTSTFPSHVFFDHNAQFIGALLKS